MRRIVVAVLLCLVSFGVYIGNGETISSSDSVPATLFAYNLFTRGTPFDDDVRGTYLDSAGGQYAFTQAANGHLVSLFPIGTALLTLPLFAAIDGVRIAASPGHCLPPLAPGFEDERRFDEKLVAAIIAALAVALCYLTARLFASPLQAGVVTYVFGFAGEMWTIGSQGLWQHGPLNLVLLGAAYCSLRACSTDARRRGPWWFAAGSCAGFLVTIRPTALLFAIAFVTFVVTDPARRTWLRAYAPGLVLGLAPGVLWNALVFHSLEGGYAVDAAMYGGGPAQFASALAGLLISPNRGWLIYSPVVLFSAVGWLRATRDPAPASRLVALLGIGGLAVLGNYASYGGWVGGHCYGPRFLTDLSAVAALALGFVLPASLGAWRARPGRALSIAAALLFAGTLGVSTVVQIVGAYSGAAGPIWNAIPVDIGIDRGRVWSWHDMQIVRNARAMFYRYVPPPTLGAAYAAGFAGSVRSVTSPGWAALPSPPGAYAAAPGDHVVATAGVHNDGASTWYGYDTAVYNGEVRLAARLSDARGAVVSEQLLYVAGIVPPGASGTARGALIMPFRAGRYRLGLRPIALGRDDIVASHERALSVIVDVR